ncbi:DUF2062 domain-containing protein [Paenibacillus sp. MWE-103]|uniref:DUF2062 domain-containing protein n=1 Tax=Paenibacillus artemisiicola TaxID=1172618 RepID=A0ABS3WAE6_9BACL|nr:MULTISPECIES: DUF2062 domain-containing protein [Paenibacillus]MBO7745257.1 DUF2062 domain-containing protein [Paenibacillus artemisiicola]SFI92154.1 hypothetical protein SAMN02799624_02686 [Paenibacillus sp. UNC496MF]
MSSPRKPRSIKRWIKYKYTQLMRAPGGPSIVALGFSIGIFVEMFTLPTYGLAFFLIFPLIYWFGASFAGALVGFVFGKIIFIPVAFVNSMVGGLVLPNHLRFHIPVIPNWLNHILLVNLKLIVGGIIDGFVLGAIFYFPVRFAIKYVADKRKEKRKLRRTALEAKPVAE